MTAAMKQPLLQKREVVHINCDDIDGSPASYNEIEVSSTHSDDSIEEQVTEVIENIGKRSLPSQTLQKFEPEAKRVK